MPRSSPSRSRRKRSPPPQEEEASTSRASVPSPKRPRRGSSASRERRPAPKKVPDAAETNAMIEQKKREIAERLAQMGKKKAVALPDPGEIARRLAEARAKAGLQAPPSSSSQLPDSASNFKSSSAATAGASMPLVPKTQFATVGANVRAAQAIETKIAKSLAAKAQEEKPVAVLEPLPKLDKAAPYYDPFLSGGKFQEMLPVGARKAPRNALRFVPQGKYVEKGKEIRKQAQMEMLREEIALKMKKAGLEGELDLVGEGAIVRENVPAIEWWDTQFFTNTLQYGDIAKHLTEISGAVSDLIHHPAPIEPPFEKQDVASRPVMLTKKEQKKARRLRRLEETKEKQEKIRLGLLPPEEPKLKLSNMMRVLGQDAVMDPTMIEKKVREQMQQRQEEHERRNLERQLTAEERREKNMRKRNEDTSLHVNVAVFRIRDLSHPQQKFKVKVNADQNHLSGICILYEDINIVVVEGGPKGINRYKNLMLKRVDWNHRPVPTSMTFEESESIRANWEKPNDCALIWEGMNRQSQYRGFRFIPCTTDLKVKEALGDKCVHYWDLARNYKAPNQ